MNLTLRLALLVCGLVTIATMLPSTSYAQSEGGYYVTWMGPDPKTVPNQPAHIVVAGYGDKLKTLLFDAAYSQAKHWVETEPTHPVVFIAYNEVGREKMEAIFKRWGLVEIAYRDHYLTPERIVAEMSFFPKIRSLDIYAHSARNPGYAPIGADPSERFLIGEGDLEAFTDRFDSKAYAAFYGCNAGYDLAPYLSELWRVPVLGALTGSDLQRLHSTGEFYAYNEDTKPAGPWASINTLSFDQPQPCAKGGCIRMKPDPHPYDGAHGKYETGLGFYKFFCRGNEEDDCTRRMMMAVLGWVSTRPLKAKSPKDTWKAVLADFICPIHGNRPLRATCLSKLSEIEAGRSMDFSPFYGRETPCDFNSCYEEDAPEELSTTSTFAREYRRYLKGLELLRLK